MQIPTPPTDRPTYEGEIATYWIDDNGILVSLSKSVRRTVENLKGNGELVMKITEGKKLPLLIYLTNSPIPDKEARQYSTEALPKLYKAMTMVSKPGLSQFIMNILFALKPPPIPMKSFTNDEEAVRWLKQFC